MKVWLPKNFSSLLSLSLLIIFFNGTQTLHGQEYSDREVAERYAIWGRDLAEEGRWHELLLGMERANDFSDLSSDISFLLALSRFHQNIPSPLVLEALYRAFAVDSWTVFDPEEARIFLAERLIALRAWPLALQEISFLKDSPKQAELQLRVLSVYRPAEFYTYLNEVLDRYPRESPPARIFLEFINAKLARDIIPNEADMQILYLLMRRLPILLPLDPDLGWMIAPFFLDIEDARRHVLAYRAVNNPIPASIPVALNLGVINEETALAEFFFPAEAYAPPGLDLYLLGEIWSLLRNNQSRNLFIRYLEGYSGIIYNDADRDGIPETIAEYRNGQLVSSSYNYLQDGIPDLVIYFSNGVPVRALAVLLPEPGINTAEIFWERFPSILHVEYMGAKYIPRPLEFFYQPFWYEDLWGSGLYFPHRDSIVSPLTRRNLVTNSIRIERPSREFSGATEIIDLADSIPIRAREYAGSLLVSETEFFQGRPILQRLDLNLDGHMDTIRYFYSNQIPSEIFNLLEPWELWDYDRDIEYTISDWDGQIRD